MILLTLSRGKGEETVRLQLPASPAEIGETFAFLDRISLDTTATAILDVSSNVPVLYRCLYDVDVEDSEQFQKLQKLAERTEALSPAKAAIFSGALDAECVWNLEGALTVADRLDEYMVSLILQNLYREILTVADENGGRLKNRVVFFADELGTCPPIQSLELMFSASRSRGLMLVPIVQSITGQLQKNYGKEGSEIIVDNCQVNLYGGFAPASQTAVELSKSLGSRTVMSGSISRGKNDPSQSLQMMERPLMTPDELKSMPKGSFIVAKTGVHPMKVKLRLFLDWGIRFRKPYEVPEKAQRSVAYADKQELEESIIRRHYGTIVMDSEQPQGGGTSAGGMAQGIQAAPDSRKTVFRP